MNDENQDDKDNREVIITAPNVQQGEHEAGKPGMIDCRDRSADLFLFVHVNSQSENRFHCRPTVRHRKVDQSTYRPGKAPSILASRLLQDR